MASNDLDRLKQQYADFFVNGRSSVAEHLTKQLVIMHDANIRKAQESTDPNEAFGYLKQASGIMEVRKHINSMSRKDVTPKE